MSNKYLGSLKCCLLSVALFIGLSASETFAVELIPNSELTLNYFTDTQSSGDDDDSSSDAVCPTGTYPVYSSGDDDSSSGDEDSNSGDDDSSSGDDDSSSSDEDSKSEDDDSSSGDDDSKSDDDDSSSSDEDSNSGDDDSSSGDDDSKSSDEDSKSEDDDSSSKDDGSSDDDSSSKDDSSSDDGSSSKDVGSSDDDGSSGSFECIACTDVSAVFSFNSRNVVITGQNFKKVTLILANGSEVDFNINGSNLNNGVVKLPNNDGNTSQPIVSIRVTTKCNTSQTIDGPALGNPNYDD